RTRKRRRAEPRALPPRRAHPGGGGDGAPDGLRGGLALHRRTMESSEEALIQARRDKAARCRERGDNPFANDVDTSDRVFVSELRRRAESALVPPEGELRYSPERVAELFGDEEAHVLGR